MNKKQMFLVFWASTIAGMAFGGVMWLISPSPRPSFIVSVLIGAASIWIFALLLIAVGFALIFIGELYEKIADKQEQDPYEDMV